MEENANDFVNYVVVEKFSQRVRWKYIAELPAHGNRHSIA
jgi:hypothetical protein